MLNIYKTNEKLVKLEQLENNSWIELISPTIEEVKEVIEKTDIDEDLIQKVLDEEELARVEVGKKSTLIVVDTPFLLDNKLKNKYDTYPLGIIIGKNHFITVSLKELEVFEDFKQNRVKNFFTEKKTRFTIQILLKIASLYQKDLKIIHEDIHKKERVLYQSTQNKELVELLNIEKTLVYFVTSLKANDIVLEKLTKGSILSLYEEDADLLEDAIIENKQAIEMANIYREILTSMTDTYATIISNNLNEIMKFLAGITIVFSIPTMIASFLGMNVPLGIFSKSPYAFLCIFILSLLVSLFTAYLLKKKNML